MRADPAQENGLLDFRCETDLLVTMISPILMAQMCADAYADAPVGFDHVWEWSGTHAVHKKIDDTDVVIFRGSLDAQDWMRDTEAVPFWDYRLGFVHPGFMCGMNDAVAAVAVALGPRIAVAGHRLGGAG